MRVWKAVLFWSVAAIVWSLGSYYGILWLFQNGHILIGEVALAVNGILLAEFAINLFSYIFSRGREKKLDELIEAIKTLVEEIRRREAREKESNPSS